MILKCSSCSLPLGECFAHYTPIEVICLYCQEEIAYFRAYFAGVIRKRSEMIECENVQFNRMDNLANIRLKISALYHGDTSITWNKDESDECTEIA